jgi:hypothetical protein
MAAENRPKYGASARKSAVSGNGTGVARPIDQPSRVMAFELGPISA